MNKKALIFDLDGTLINTVGDLNTAVNYALKHFNFPLRSIEQTTNDIGNGVSKLIERSLPKENISTHHKETLEIFRNYYREHYFDSSFPYNNVKETLINLKNKGYVLGVVTNKFDEGAKKLMEHYFKGIFDVVIGETPLLPKKPDPAMLNKAIDILNINKEDVIYLGDTEIDYETANNANVDVILVTYGYRNKSQLLEKIKNAPMIDAFSELNNLF